MWIRWPAVVALAFLAVHSVSYGTGFISNPAAGAGEFGENEPATVAAENLAGLVGVVLLLLAATAIAAAILLIRRHAEGAWLAVGLGVALISIGLYWASRDNTWDAGFYGALGLMLAILGGRLARPGVSNEPGKPVVQESSIPNERGPA